MKKRYFFNERNDLKSFEQSWKNDRFLINEQRFTKKRFFCWKKNFIGERILLDERLYWTNDFSEQNILLNNCSGKKHDIDRKKTTILTTNKLLLLYIWKNEIGHSRTINKPYQANRLPVCSKIINWYFSWEQI